MKAKKQTTQKKKATREKWAYEREIARKGVHLLSLSFVVIYILFAILFGHRTGLFALAFLLVILIEFEYVRIEMKKKIPFISRFWWVKRPKERERLGGEVFFLIGSIICLAIFDLRVAVAAILMTTFGDMAASLIGKKFGYLKVPFLRGKKWEGVVAEFVVDIVVGFLIVRTIENGTMWWLGGAAMGMPIYGIIIPMAIVATTVETIIKKLDDNLLIPVFAGFTGQVALIIISTFF